MSAAMSDSKGLVERLTAEQKVDLRDIVSVRALLDRCAANAGEAAAAIEKLEGDLGLVCGQRDYALKSNAVNWGYLKAAEAQVSDLKAEVERLREATDALHMVETDPAFSALRQTTRGFVRAALDAKS